MLKRETAWGPLPLLVCTRSPPWKLGMGHYAIVASSALVPGHGCPRVGCLHRNGEEEWMKGVRQRLNHQLDCFLAAVSSCLSHCCRYAFRPLTASVSTSHSLREGRNLPSEFPKVHAAHCRYCWPQLFLASNETKNLSFNGHVQLLQLFLEND